MKTWMTEPPIGDAFYRDLLEYINTSHGNVESVALELKGSLTDPLSSSGIAKIVKFVIGAANREPEEANRYFAGYAIMLIGVDGDGTTKGVDVFEELDLRQKLEKYLGPEGPNWTSRWLQDENEPGRGIMAILVSPPRDGDPIYYCHSDGQGINDGEIYVRRQGQTTKAHSTDLYKLNVRSQKSASPMLDLSVEVRAFSVTSDTSDLEFLKAHVIAKYDELISLAPEKSEIITIGSTSLRQVYPFNYSTFETRTPEEYRTEVEEWRDWCLRDIASLRERLIIALLPNLEVRIENLSQRFAKNLELMIRTDPDTAALLVSRTKGLPVRQRVKRAFHSPRPWLEMPAVLSRLDPPADIQATLDQNKMMLVLSLDQLRPRAKIEGSTSKALLLIQDPRNPEVEPHWEATYEGNHTVLSGTATVSVEPINSTDLIRKHI